MEREAMPSYTASELAGPQTPRCRACGRQILFLEGDNVAHALTEHLKNHPDCLDYYADENMLVEIMDGRLIIAGTLDLHFALGEWKLKGLCPNGEVDYFGAWGNKEDAIDFGTNVLIAHIEKYGNPDGRIIPDNDSTWA